MSSTPVALGNRIEISGYDPTETVDDLMWISSSSFEKRIGAMYASVYADFYGCKIYNVTPGGSVGLCLLFKHDVATEGRLVNALNRDFDGTYRLTEDGKEGIEDFLLPDAHAFEAMIFGTNAVGKTNWDSITDEVSYDGELLTRVSRLDANRLAAAAFGRGDSRTEYKYQVTAKGTNFPCTLEISRESRTIVCIGCGVY